MPTKVLKGSRKLPSADAANGGNGHANRERSSSTQRPGDGTLLLVSQEIMRL